MRWLVIGLAMIASKLAIAGHTIIEADGAVNLGVTQRTESKIAPDPNPEPGDIAPSSVTTPFLELRPAIGISRGSERVHWRARYQFAGILQLDSTAGVTYTNQADVAFLAQATQAIALAIETSVAQGGTQFLLGQRAAAAGSPEFRAPGNPNLVMAIVGESLNVEISRELQLQQGLRGFASAPQDDLNAYSATLMATLAIQRVFKRDQIGLEVRAAVSELKPLQLDKPAYFVQNNALLARWNRDLSRTFSGYIAAGAEQVYIDEGPRPVAVLPTADASLMYMSGNKAGSIEASQAANMNLQLGTATSTTRVGVRGTLVLDPIKLRTISFSAGALHNEPLAASAPILAAGTGNALQADAAFTTQLSKKVVATARYSATYQFDQAAGIPASLVHIAMIGVTALYTNTEQARARQKPSFGRRVDGSDAVPLGDRPAAESQPR